MTDVFIVMRIITTKFGDQITIPLDGCYTSKQEAMRDKEQWDRSGAGLLGCRLIHMGADGNVDAGLTANDFLESLGIATVTHKLMVRRVSSKFVDPDELQVLGHA